MNGKATELRYNQLIQSPRLDHDLWARPNLETFRLRHIKMYEAIETYLEGARDSIADIGCQNGFFLRLASELGFKRFVAVDYFVLEDERSFLSELAGVEFVRSNFNEDNFLRVLADESQDVVVSTEVVEHICHHPLGYLRECWRVLRHGGLLLLSTPNPTTLVNAVRLALGKEISWGSMAFAETPKLGPDGLPVAMWDIHFREYTHEILSDIVGKLDGAEIVERGFLANAPSSSEPLSKRLALSIVSGVGPLSSWRPLCATQYMIVKRR
jgi:2-polyprenyl-3-methyl-5-hydroxy-6-metoxy-1,4-benzoquinol methylase